jgi:hypothetical protein
VPADRAAALLTTPGKDEPQASPIRGLVASALASPDKIDRAALLKLIDQKVEGPDAVVLLAVTAKRAGGDVWRQFRAESADLLGDQPLPGAVVVLINRLAEADSPIASK